MLPLSSVRPRDIRHIRFSFACSRRQTTRRQSEAPKDVPDHTSCRALSRHSLTDLFAGAPHPYYHTSAPFSFSAGECKIMNHFVVSQEKKVAGELILIIEDNEKNRKLVRDVLQVKGYKTIETETAEEGLKLALQQSPALILMDIQLPGMDGITALKQLRANPKTQGISIIAITASAMTNNRTSMLAEGFDGYQTKPISLKDFLGEVQRVLALRGLNS